jgi:membrane-bound lytic murein transglycosylase D
MVTWQAYKLRSGDSLQAVASRFGLSLETLRSVNGIGPRAKVPVGHALLVPTQAPSDATVASLQNAVFTTVPSGRTFYHRVRKGETLQSIAAHYDVSTQDLRGWNAGVASKLSAGQRLRVVSDAGPVSAKKSKQGRKIQAAAASAVAGNGGGPIRPASKTLGQPRRRTHHAKAS